MYTLFSFSQCSLHFQQGMTPNSESSESSFDNTGLPKVLRPDIKGKKLDLPAKNNLLTKYFCILKILHKLCQLYLFYCVHSSSRNF